MAEPTHATIVASAPDELVTAVRTFLFADMRGYTHFTLERGDEATATLVQKFVALMREGVTARGGQVLELRGDEAMAVFGSARQALRAAVELQARFLSETEEEPALPLSVGMGLDVGEAVAVEGGYRGGALNLAARLCNLAAAGEVLASDGVVHLARKVDGLEYLERGHVQLKGFAEPVRVVQVVRDEGEAVGEQPIGDRTGQRNWGNDVAGRLTEQGVKVELPIGGFLGSLPEGLLVAREEELRRILEVVDAVEAGAGRLLLLAGEPGVGKTRLAQEVTVALRNRDFLVATGRCYEPEQTVAFYPFQEALAMAYSAAPAAIRTALPRRWPQVGRLLPDQVPVTRPASQGDDEQQRLFWAITGFIHALSETSSMSETRAPGPEAPRRAGVAVLLDDVHWADDSSLKLLQHLARHTRANRVLLLATYRDVEVGLRHPLERALLDLHREHLVTQVTVGRLSREGTAALVAAMLDTDEVPAELAALIHERTEGNPFFVREMLRALVERGDAAGARLPAEIEVPENVQAVIRQRLARLPDDAQEILHEASVLGQTFQFDDLRALRARSEDEVETVVQEAVAAGLVNEVGEDGYSFNHALTQQTLYAELPRRRRRRLHLAAAEALEHLPDQVRERRAAELARHSLEGGDLERALPCVLVAGDQAEAVFAHAEAERQYRTALRLAEELGHEPGQRKALEKLGSVLKTIGRYDEALEALERATRLYRAAGDLEGEGRVTAQIGFVLHVEGVPENGIARLETLLESLEQPDRFEALSHAGPSLYSALVHLFMLSGRYEESLATAERFEKLARAIASDPILASAGMLRGEALRLLGHQAAALKALEEAISRAERAGDTDTLSLALDVTSDVYMARGELLRCKAYRVQMLKLFERLGDPAKSAYGMATLGFVTHYLGDWRDARRQCERARDLIGSTDSSRVAAYPLIGLGMCALGEGDRSAARAYLEEAVDICERTGGPEALTYGQRLLAELDLQEDHPEAARIRLDLLLGDSGVARDHLPGLLSVLAEACLIGGDHVQAEEAVLDGIRQAAQSEGRLALVDLLRVRGMVLTQQGHWKEAQASFSEALSQAQDMPYPYGAARALREWGTMHMRAGQPAQAGERWEEARTAFQHLGASRQVEETKHALAQLH